MNTPLEPHSQHPSRTSPLGFDPVDIQTTQPFEPSTALPSKIRHKKSFLFYRNSTFCSLVIGYGGFYLCRQNLGTAFGPMQSSLGIDPIAFGWISSIGTLTYALGKVGLSSFADSKLGGKTVFYISLFSSALFCLLFGLGHGMTYFLIMWGIGRSIQSMGWSGLVRITTHWFPKRTYGTAMGFMSISYQLGGAIANLYCGLILALGGNWQSLFIIPSLTLMCIGLLTFPFLRNCPEDVGHQLIEEDSCSAKAKLSSQTSLPSSEESITYISRFKLLLSNPAFLGMLGLSFLLTFFRECFSVWTPAYFSSLGSSTTTAIFKSTLFPILGCAGTLAGGWISDRFFTGRRAPVIAGLLTLLILCLMGLGKVHWLAHFFQNTLHLNLTASHLATLLVAASGFFLLGSYSFVGGVVALDFGGKKIAGTASGLLDGVGYLGATLAGVGVAQFVVHAGWEFTFSTMALCGLMGIFLCWFLWHTQPVKH